MNQEDRTILKRWFAETREMLSFKKCRLNLREALAVALDYAEEPIPLWRVDLVDGERVCVPRFGAATGARPCLDDDELDSEMDDNEMDYAQEAFIDAAEKYYRAWDTDRDAFRQRKRRKSAMAEKGE